MGAADDNRQRGGKEANAWADAPVDQRPGFLIRRLHQVHSALFAQEIAPERVTPMMYSVMSALRQLGPVDQKTLAAAVAIDKTNMADILERLRRKGLVTRRVLSSDRRVRMTELTREGRAMLERVDPRPNAPMRGRSRTSPTRSRRCSAA